MKKKISLIIAVVMVLAVCTALFTVFSASAANVPADSDYVLRIYKGIGENKAATYEEITFAELKSDFKPWNTDYLKSNYANTDITVEILQSMNLQANPIIFTVSDNYTMDIIGGGYTIEGSADPVVRLQGIGTGSTINVSGLTIKNTKNGKGAGAAIQTYKAVINFENCNVNAENHWAINNSSAKAININGGSYVGSTGSSYGAFSGTVTVSGITTISGNASGTLTVSGGENTITSGKISSTVTHNGGELNVTGGTISGVVKANGGELNLTGGIVNNKVEVYEGATLNVDETAKITRSSTDNWSWAIGIHGGTVNIGGGTVINESTMDSSKAGLGMAINCYTGTLSISGGVVASTGGGAHLINIAGNLGVDSTVTISGGTIINNNKAATLYVRNVADDKKPKIKITGGTIVGVNKSISYSDSAGKGAEVTISGGKVEGAIEISPTMTLDVTGGLVGGKITSAGTVKLDGGTIVGDVASSGGSVTLNSGKLYGQVTGVEPTYGTGFDKTNSYNIPVITVSSNGSVLDSGNGYIRYSEIATKLSASNTDDNITYTNIADSLTVEFVEGIVVTTDAAISIYTNGNTVINGNGAKFVYTGTGVALSVVKYGTTDASAEMTSLDVTSHEKGTALSNDAELTIKNGVILGNVTTSGILNVEGGTIQNGNGTLITGKGGEINISEADPDCPTLIYNNGSANAISPGASKLTITGGTVKSKSSGSNTLGIYDAAAEISGGTIQNEGGGNAIRRVTDSNVTVSGSANVIGIVKNEKSGPISITGGTINGKVNGNVIINGNISGTIEFIGGTSSITGGTINGNIKAVAGSFEINGDNVETENIERNVTVKGKITIGEASDKGGTFSIKNAIIGVDGSLQNDAVMICGREVTIENCVITANNRAVQVEDTTKDTTTFDGKLTIKNCTVTAKNTGDHSALRVQGGAEASVINGEYTSSGSDSGTIRVLANGKLTITNATVTNNSPSANGVKENSWALYDLNNTATVTIDGGIYVGGVKTSNSTELTIKGNFKGAVTTGKALTISEGAPTITGGTLSSTLNVNGVNLTITGGSVSGTISGTGTVTLEAGTISGTLKVGCAKVIVGKSDVTTERTVTVQGGILVNGATAITVNNGVTLTSSSGDTATVQLSTNSGSSLEVEDGATVTTTSAGKWIPAVRAYKGTTVLVSGGTIQNDSASSNKVAVLAYEGSSVRITDGLITSPSGSFTIGLYKNSTLSVEGGEVANTDSEGEGSVVCIKGAASGGAANVKMLAGKLTAASSTSAAIYREVASNNPDDGKRYDARVKIDISGATIKGTIFVSEGTTTSPSTITNSTINGNVTIYSDHRNNSAEVNVQTKPVVSINATVNGTVTVNKDATLVINGGFVSDKIDGAGTLVLEPASGSDEMVYGFAKNDQLKVYCAVLEIGDPNVTSVRTIDLAGNVDVKGATTVNVNNGVTVIASGDRADVIRINSDSATINVKAGATVEGKADTGKGMSINAAATVNIYGTVTGSITLDAAAKDGFTVNIFNGASVEGKMNLTKVGTVNISGGTTVITEGSDVRSPIALSNGATLTVTGGRTSGEISGAGTVILEPTNGKFGLAADDQLVVSCATLHIGDPTVTTERTIDLAGNVDVKGATTVNVNQGVTVIASGGRADVIRINSEDSIINVNAGATVKGKDGSGVGLSINTAATVNIYGTVSGPTSVKATDTPNFKLNIYDGATIDTAMDLTKAGIITITGGTISGDLSVTGGKLTVTGGKVTNVNNNGGTANITDGEIGTVTVEGNTAAVTVKGGTVSTIAVTGGTATVEGGTVSTLNVTGGAATVENTVVGPISVSGGSVTLTDAGVNGGKSAALTAAGGTVNATNTTFKSEAATTVVVGEDSEATVNLNFVTVYNDHENGAAVSGDLGTANYTAAVMNPGDANGAHAIVDGYYVSMGEENITPLTQSGASIRFTDANVTTSGIRFVSTIAVDDNVLPAGATVVGFGTYIVPTSKLYEGEYNGEFDPAELLTDGNDTNDPLKILATEYGWSVVSPKNENGRTVYSVRAALVGLEERHYDVPFSAIAYLEYTLDGTTCYIYGMYDEASNSRSIGFVADAALRDSSDKPSNEYPYLIVDSFNGLQGKYSPYTKSQREELKSIVEVYVSANN